MMSAHQHDRFLFFCIVFEMFQDWLDGYCGDQAVAVEVVYHMELEQLLQKQHLVILRRNC